MMASIELVSRRSNGNAIYKFWYMWMSVSTLTTEQATKQFYQRFSSIRTAFLFSLQTVENEEARQAYVSLLLNRLLFVFFLQSHCVLDNDPNYLQHHLHSMRTHSGPNTFFHLFLLPFFYKGLCSPERSPASLALFGSIPYLEQTLFLPQALEDTSLSLPQALEDTSLSLPDEPFCSLFTFFEHYHWSLDEQQLSAQTITPALLGHIFELSVNQQEMGAYYTPEDVTGYIAINTLIPHLFSTVAPLFPAEFSPSGPIWRQLQLFPKRYIQTSLQSLIPLSGETDDECAARLVRYVELHELLSSASLSSIDDCVTYNLDLLTFTLDTLRTLASPSLLLSFYQSLLSLRVLDPTCGSGAFLFASLTILLPLYETCLERMNTLQSAPTGSMLFHDYLEQTTTYPNLRSFALHTLLTQTLYGVDLMPEAIELCKLRLSLLLLAETSSPSLPKHLPSLTHHLRAGNALVGFLSSSSLPTETTETLDSQLAAEYGISDKDSLAFSQWRSHHQPFHWWHSFPEVAAQGGFSVILGNPPYVEYDARSFPYTLQHFSTLPCANLYPCVVERSYQLLSPHGRLGMILPLAACSTRNMLPLITGLRSWFPASWISFYHFRPSMLFSGSKIASIPTLILLARLDGSTQRFSTHLLKWKKDQRSQLFSSISYCAVTAPEDCANPHYYPKLGQACENSILEKVLSHPRLRSYLSSSPNQNFLSYRSAGGLYWKVFLNFPWPYHTTSNKQCFFQPAYDRDVFVALLNSSLFWWYYTVTFDTFNLKDYMLFGFRFTYPDDPSLVSELKMLCQLLMQDFRLHARHLKRGQTNSYTLYARKSKPLLDEIDAILAQIYGFTPSEHAFIISYDLKYRLGLY
jgi:hypothetical protein